jgi:PAS domain S-box-containing protein
LVSRGDTVDRQVQRLFETSLDLILVTDGFGRIIRVSPSSMRLLSYTSEEMVGRLDKDFIYSPDLDSTRAEMQGARHGNVMRNFRCRYVHRDRHPVSLTWTGVWSGRDRLHFFIGRDITDIEAKEEQVQRSRELEAAAALRAVEAQRLS